MKCPLCVQPDLVMTDRQGVEIDYCPQCRGVWLDRGELDKIIDRSESALSQPQSVAQPPRDQDRDHQKFQSEHRHSDEHYYGGKHRKKRGGLLGELFDFD